MKKIIKSNAKRIVLSLLVLALLIGTLVSVASFADNDAKGKAELTQTIEKTDMVADLLALSDHYVLVRAKQLGGSHYAYTEGLAEDLGSANQDPMGAEAVFNPNASLVLLSLKDNGDGTVSVYEDELYKTTRGFVRDPDVSADGTKVLFSMKESPTDDFHLYEMTLADRSVKQLTFGSGIADFEGKYLPNGKIVFCSSRDIQTVDCWKTPVSNLYICDADGSNIIRVGYDQVHTTYPTVTDDGRVIYTRWDYNDRNQMYVQGVFQMFADGTNQTELFGNDSNFPTTLLHTREIPGTQGKYISIATGHHVTQKGKLVIVDTNKGRNDDSAITFIGGDGSCVKKNSVDTGDYGASTGKVYKYPYALNEDEYLVAYSNAYNNASTAFDVILMNKKGESVVIAKGTSVSPASQIVPIITRDLFDRPSSVDYSKSSGTYYVANVYEGGGLAGIEKGSAKYLRVVALGFRSSSIGATIGSGTGTSDQFTPVSTGNGSWDVKQVLGIVPIEEDGSVMFRVPSEMPLYFQILDEKGQMIQSMRSWSTLMPNETFSCVGCHESKNTTPSAASSTTLAMKKGVQDLIPDLWMSNTDEYKSFDPYTDAPIGFDYMTQIQGIFDKSCVECHSDSDAALKRLDAQISGDATLDPTVYLIKPADEWSFANDSDETKTAHAPFGASGADVNTAWKSGALTLTKTIRVTQYDKEACKIQADIEFKGRIEFYVNDKLVYSGENTSRKVEKVRIPNADVKLGENTIKVICSSGDYIDCPIRAYTSASDKETLVTKGDTYKYLTMAKAGNPKPADDWFEVDFDDSSWSTGASPFGDRNNDKTKWDNSKLLFLRCEFNIEDISAYSAGELSMNAWFDDNATIYLNGTVIFHNSGWIDSYQNIALTNKSGSLLRQGKNVLAISLNNADSFGGSEWDGALYVTKVDSEEAGTSTAPVSFEGYMLAASRMQKEYPLSYLVLTGSKLSSGTQWVGNATNKFTNWISSMSRCEMLDPYSTGSSKSALITKLREGHGNLSENEIRAIECWIDLGVPCYGTYDAGNIWGANSLREYTEKANKRAFYDMMDKETKKQIAGTNEKGSIEITYNKKATVTGEGFAVLYTNAKYKNGDTVSVKLPKGQNYVFVSLSSKMGEALLYLPDGKWDYTFADLNTSFIGSMNPGMNTDYTANTITARIPSKDELAADRNLAFNPYDQTKVKNLYPHATADNYYNNQGEFAPRNAIDGFSCNTAHGNFPYQSWGPTNASGHWFEVDFGREIVANELKIAIRADFPHDTHFTSAIIEFSDGTTEKVQMYRTSDTMVFDLGSKTTSSIKIKSLSKATSDWGALSEVSVIGHEK